jgi:hypothetical protein
MDVLTPFLPRIAHFKPLDKSTLFVVGVSDNKLTKVHEKRFEPKLSTLKHHQSEHSSDNKTDTDNQNIDTWA